MFRSFDSDSYTADGLNRIAAVDGTTAGYDSLGNPGSSPGQAMTADPVTGKTASYWRTNDQLWVSSPPWASHSYDALDRLGIIDTGSAATRFAYDGLSPIAEYDGAGALQRRYVFDPTTGQPRAGTHAPGREPA